MPRISKRPTGIVGGLAIVPSSSPRLIGRGVWIKLDDRWWEALARYRKLAKASIAQKSEVLERAIALQLAEIKRLQTEMDASEGTPKARCASGHVQS